MRLVVSDEADELIAQRGGRLYVWVKRRGCCGNKTLASATEPPAHMRFRHAAGDGRIDVFVPEELSRLPDELHLDERRFPRRVEAYWDGCAWLT
jgi:hypothetical protein